jgi:hypothetical protein
MKIIFVLYIILWIITGILGTVHRNDVDENGEFKIAWWWIIWFIMLMFTPVMARLTGIM